MKTIVWRVYNNNNGNIIKINQIIQDKKEEEEFREIFNKLKLGKAGGEDSLTAEMIKCMEHKGNQYTRKDIFKSAG